MGWDCERSTDAGGRAREPADARGDHAARDRVLGLEALISAVELGVFSELAGAGALDAEALRERLGLHPRGARDFFDALVALGMLERENGCYTNTPATELFLDRAKPSYMGGVLEMASIRVYRHWGLLTEALRTGLPQNEAKAGEDLFEMLYADPVMLAQFVRTMTGASTNTARTIAAKFPWRDYRSVIDIGCSGAPCQFRSPWRTSTSPAVVSICPRSGRSSIRTSRAAGSASG